MKYNPRGVICCVVALVAFIAPITSHAQQSELLPLCGIVAGPEEWNNLNPAISMTGQHQLVATVVKKGLHYNCVAQLRMVLRYIEEEDRSYWISSHLTTLPTGRAVPDTFHPENGEVQLVHLSVDSPAESSFQTCYPGYSYKPNQYCSSDLYDGKLSSGVVIYRQRHEDGSFQSSPWVASNSGAPGFIIRRKGACLTPRTGCEYEIIFPKNNDGTFQLKKDLQVLIQTTVRLDGAFVETDGFNSWMATPLLITRSVPEPTPTPGSQPSPTPTADEDDDETVSANDVIYSWVIQAKEIVASIKKKLTKKNRKQQLALRTELKEIAQTISDEITSNMGEIVTYGDTFNLEKSRKMTFRKLRIFANKKKPKGFAKRKKGSLKALRKLESGVMP